MISITKNTKDPFEVTYTLEVYTDKELLYKQSVKFGKNETNVDTDKLARIQMIHKFFKDCDIQTMDELFKIIPVYEKDE